MPKKLKEKNNSSGAGEKAGEEAEHISTAEELHAFLASVKDKLGEDAGAPVHAVSAMNYVMNLPNIYDILNARNKELARDIWLRIKQSGFQLRKPPMLFGEEEDSGTTVT